MLNAQPYRWANITQEAVDYSAFQVAGEGSKLAWASVQNPENRNGQVQDVILAPGSAKATRQSFLVDP
jgi:hypothetical protein